MRLHVIKRSHRELYRVKASGHASTVKRYTCCSITQTFSFHVKRVITYVQFLYLYLFRFDAHRYRLIPNREGLMIKCSLLIGRYLLTPRLSSYHFRFYLYHTSVNLHHTWYHPVKRLIGCDRCLANLRPFALFRFRASGTPKCLQRSIRVLPSTCNNKVKLKSFRQAYHSLCSPVALRHVLLTIHLPTSNQRRRRRDGYNRVHSGRLLIRVFFLFYVGSW